MPRFGSRAGYAWCRRCHPPTAGSFDMPIPNRVRPDGTLFADPARGLLLGNRGGRFHEAGSRSLPKRSHATRQWICCLLVFKDRRRSVWGQGYTELFFCDEVTALAAGHRPCMECRRADALAYRAALMRGLGLVAAPLFPEIDRRLDMERRRGRLKRLHRMPAETLPDGAMIELAPGSWAAVLGGAALPWSPTGYGEALPRPGGLATTVTPPSSLLALANGYRPLWHDSAAVPR